MTTRGKADCGARGADGDAIGTDCRAGRADNIARLTDCRVRVADCGASHTDSHASPTDWCPDLAAYTLTFWSYVFDQGRHLLLAHLHFADDVDQILHRSLCSFMRTRLVSIPR